MNDLTEFEKFQQDEGFMVSVSIFSLQFSSLLTSQSNAECGGYKEVVYL